MTMRLIQMEDTFMPISATPYREPRFAAVNGRRMAYIDEGVGDTIVFQHGNPTSSYLWRNIMPHCEGLGRLIACDLIGMGRSDKLSDSGPERYSYQEQRDYLFALWELRGAKVKFKKAWSWRPPWGSEDVVHVAKLRRGQDGMARKASGLLEGLR